MSAISQVDSPLKWVPTIGLKENYVTKCLDEIEENYAGNNFHPPTIWKYIFLSFVKKQASFTFLSN